MSENKEVKWKKILKEYLPYIFTIILVLLFKKYVVSPIKVNGDSMNNTLLNGDIMILNSLEYRFHKIKRFDIVVVRGKNELLIKRIIGLPGEKIEYKNNKLYVNGKRIKDKYGKDKTKDFSTVVGKNSYYVLGDNRNNSLDSRYFGDFKKKDILGKTSLTVFPIKRMGNKK